MSLPSNITVPVVGLYRPVMQLKNVVLPAPLGPISETMALCGTEKSTSLTATRPPNTFEMPVASSSGARGRGTAGRGTAGCGLLAHAWRTS